MIDRAPLKSPVLLEKVTKIINRKLSKTQAALVTRFSKHFYNSVSEADLIDRNAEELYASILSLWNFSQGIIPADKGKMSVDNPTIEEHGWTSKHTVIELLHVDMPFMVDSIRMVLNRLGLNTHLMIHVSYHFTRSKVGKITGLEVLHEDKEVITETPMYIEVDRQADDAALKELQENLQNVLNDVYVTVKDWVPMCDKLSEVINEVSKAQYPKRKTSLN